VSRELRRREKVIDSEKQAPLPKTDPTAAADLSFCLEKNT
jgi:hypothetical protein